MAAFAVLGCGRIGRIGRIGRMYARNLARHPRAELVGVYDIVKASSDEVARELGVRAAASVDELLADTAVEAVLIASSTDTHIPLITAAVRAGKAVLCEKPIDLDIARAIACWAEIGKLNPTAMIGFNRRFDPSFRALRDRLGEIGTLEQVIITSRDQGPPPIAYIKVSGGLFRDMTTHDFDMARYLAGDIVEVQAFGANLVDPAIKTAGDIDAAMVTLRAASRALLHITNSRRATYGYDQRIEAFGSLGMLTAGNRRATTVELPTGTATDAKDPALNFFIERYQEACAAEIDHFVTALAGRSTPPASFDDGLLALRPADAALESMASGKIVRLS